MLKKRYILEISSGGIKIILHIFPKEKFTYNYIEFVNKNFKQDDHFFLIVGENNLIKDDFSKYSNVAIYRNRLVLNSIKLIRANNIILHSLFIPKLLTLYILCLSYFNKKIGWVIWGGDLHQTILGNKKGAYRSILKNIRIGILRRLSLIIALTKKDGEIALDKFSLSIPTYNVIYGDGRLNSILKRIPVSFNEKKFFLKEKIRIIVGNSATVTNNHIEALQLLEKFKKENIEILVPLSYGDSDYRERVISIGHKLFGEKFKPIIGFMDYEEYIKLLSSIDIAIFNIKREQQALGNIRLLAYFGTKLYLNLDTSMGKELSNSCSIYSIDDLEKETFNEFLEFSKNNKKINYNAMMNIFDEQVQKKQWNTVFNFFN